MDVSYQWATSEVLWLWELAVSSKAWVSKLAAGLRVSPGSPSAASRPAVRRQRPPSSSLATPLRYQPHCDPSHHQWFAQCPRTARIAWAVIEWHPGRRTSCQGCCCAAQRGLTDPWTRPDARTRPSSSLHVAYSGAPVPVPLPAHSNHRHPDVPRAVFPRPCFHARGVA